MGTEPASDLWLPANWNAPPRIAAGTTLRRGGVSRAPFDSLNLAMHVGDLPGAVTENRRRVAEALELPSEPVWLNQIHGDTVIKGSPHGKPVSADGCYTDQGGVVCAVMTADCIPLLLCNRAGSEIAAVHVGWRGLCAGIIPAAMASFQEKAANLLAWIGPHISAKHYEVGNEVRAACADMDEDAINGFTRNQQGNWQADLDKITRIILVKHGLTAVSGCGRCTYAEDRDFFSYRRANRTGRMASFIWMAKSNN